MAFRILCVLWACLWASAALAQDMVERGAYLVRAGGCFGCHTEKGGEPYAGGRALKTPFGTFYSPNITPDPETGIGAWSDENFLAAMREGIGPDGSHLYPVFPYPSYTRVRDEDVDAVRAYLFSLPPVEKANRDHDLTPPFGWRWTMMFWKWLFFDPGPWPEPEAPDQRTRGRYLTDALAHCGECHTPRNIFGAPDKSMYLAGTTEGPDGEIVPNITPDPETGIGNWSVADIVYLLREGFKPNFDDVQGSMAEAIQHGLKYLRQEDLEAIAIYLKSLPPIRNKVERQVN